MDVIDALNEVRMLNKRMGNVDHDSLLETTLDRHNSDQKEIDDQFNGKIKTSVLKGDPDTASESSDFLTEAEAKKRF